MNKFTISEFIRIILLSLLLIWTFYLIKPFIGIVAWGGILAIAIYPFYEKLIKNKSAKSKKWITIVFTLAIIALIIVPSYLLVESIINSVGDTFTKIKNDEFQITPPSEKVKEWPIIGEKLYKNWSELSVDMKKYIFEYKEFIITRGESLFYSLVGFIGTFFTFLFSFIIAIIFMSNAKSSYDVSLQLVNKILGRNGENMVLMARNTIRNVVKGVLFVAIIQSIICFIAFKAIGIPAAGLFAMLVLMAGIMHIPVTLVVLPTILLAFNITDNNTHAIIFSIFIIVASLIDNVLRPIFLAKGLQTPMVLIVVGAIGGILLHGIIGLFIGTVLMALMHQLYIGWVTNKDEQVLID